MILPVPYEKGWELTVNGHQTDIEQANYAFIGFPIEKEKRDRANLLSALYQNSRIDFTRQFDRCDPLCTEKTQETPLFSISGVFIFHLIRKFLHPIQSCIRSFLSISF